MKTRKNNKKLALKFFKNFRKKVGDKQAEIITDCMEELYSASPHAGAIGSDFSESEYDANHKISINNGDTSMHHPPTNSPVMSKTLIDTEKLKAEGIECGDQVTITNDTAHAYDVEVGPLLTPTRWQRPGYFTYQRTLNTIKNRYKDVLK